MHSQDQSDTGESEYAVMPDDADDNPGREVYEGDAKMPGTDEVLSAVCYDRTEKTILAIFWPSQEVPWLSYEQSVHWHVPQSPPQVTDRRSQCSIYI
jgi:hypothetical protein